MEGAQNRRLGKFVIFASKKQKRMKRLALMLLLIATATSGLHAQRVKPRADVPYARYRAGYVAGTEVDEMTGDTAYVVQLSNVLVYRSLGDIRRHRRLIRNVKAVYPYAIDARNYFNSLTAQLDTVTTKKERERITKNLEKEIVERYTPVLEKMTYSQGKILIRLIDRETERTSYELLEEFRGKFAAKFWNTIARIFRANLKQEYDPTQGEDKLIEQIINLYEAGLL